MNILAQIVGILAIVVFAISPHQKTKKKVLIFNIISCLLYATQYLMLGAFSAAATNIIGAGKDRVFYEYEKKEKNIPIMALLIYIAILVISGVLTYTNIFSVFPVLLSSLSAYGVWQKNLKVYRNIVVINSVAWLIYNFAVGAYVGAIGNAFQIGSAIIAIIRLDVIKNKKDVV
ncbi:MAG: YgjV family protein [Clostridia bacterium]|jgi:hypothetical protein|nr:YgjV family protein [Clostridia bacterium]